MKIAITGGAGFVGRHLAERYDPSQVVVVSRRTGVDIDDLDALAEAFAGCDVVAHCAGINREIGAQTYQKVHIDGTRAVVEAARRAGVRRILMLSFLRARPGCGSPYHESKWAAEELIRQSGLDYTILKAGMIYGQGDHLVDHVSRSVQTVPLFATVGLHEKSIRPIPIAEMVDVLVAAADGELPDSTVAVVGGEELMLSEVVHRIAGIVDRRVLVVPAPVWAIRALAQITEWTMKVPLIAKAQARMLAEGVSEAAPPTDDCPTRSAHASHFQHSRSKQHYPSEEASRSATCAWLAEKRRRSPGSRQRGHARRSPLRRACARREVWDPPPTPRSAAGHVLGPHAEAS